MVTVSKQACSGSSSVYTPRAVEQLPFLADEFNVEQVAP